MSKGMTPKAALRILEIADITIDGKDTVNERIGEFRTIVERALRKMIPEKPYEVDVSDEGTEKVVVVCPSCSETLDLFMQNMKFCPFCGKRFH